MNLYAVIPSRNRPEMLANLVRQLVGDGVRVIIIDTGYTPPLMNFSDKDIEIIRDDEDPPNISRWWNLGLDAAHSVQMGIDGDYVVAVLNDDLVIPPRFVSLLAAAIVRHNATAAYPDQHGFGLDHRHTFVGPISLYRRMTGYAFALRGSAGIRADETLQWWYGDDDIDWRARQIGGSVLVGGVSVQHLSPNSSTVGKLAEQAGRDRQTFIDKWGRAPW